MNNKIILILILITLTIINFFVTKLTREHPEYISGFKWGNTKEEISNDKKWIKSLAKAMCFANLITLIGGIFSILLDNSILFYIFISFPIPSIIFYVYIHGRVNATLRSPIKGGLIIGAIFMILLLLPLLYSHYSELDLVLGKEYFEIKGLYGKKINYLDIKSISLDNQLPNMKMRINGFSLGQTKLGYFITEDYKNVTLFTHSDSSCIKIVCNNGNIIYLNCKTTHDTLNTFELLREIK